MRRARGDRWAMEAARAEEFDLGGSGRGRTNAVVKSEVVVARSGKRATATLATTRSWIRATATPFSFFPFFIYFSSHFIFFLSPYSISFIFNYLSICFPFNFISFSSSEFRLKRAATNNVAVALFHIDCYYYVYHIG